MIKGKTIHIVLVIFLITNIFLLVELNKKKKEVTECIDNSTIIVEKNQNLNVLNIEVVNSFKDIFLNSETSLDKNTFVVSASRDTVYFSDLFNKANSLVFQFSPLSCAQCIEQQVDVLNKYESSFISKMVVFIHSENLKELNFIKENYKIRNEMYLLPSNLGFEFEDEFAPYFFVAGKDLIARFVYRPVNGSQKTTEAYLSILQSRLDFD